MITLKNPYAAKFIETCMGRSACPKIAHVVDDCEKLRGVQEVLGSWCSVCLSRWPPESVIHADCREVLADGRVVQAWRVFRMRMADGSVEEFEYELPADGSTAATAIEIPWM